MGKTYRNSSNVRTRVTVTRKDRINHKRANQELRNMRAGRIDYSTLRDDEMDDLLHMDEYGQWTMESD